MSVKRHHVPVRFTRSQGSSPASTPLVTAAVLRCSRRTVQCGFSLVNLTVSTGSPSPDHREVESRPAFLAHAGRQARTVHCRQLQRSVRCLAGVQEAVTRRTLPHCSDPTCLHVLTLDVQQPERKTWDDLARLGADAAMPQQHCPVVSKCTPVYRYFVFSLTEHSLVTSPDVARPQVISAGGK